jgi:tRNA pseudouridine-54 N-methylase
MEHITTNSGNAPVKFHCVAGTRDKIGHVSCLARQRNCNLMPSAIIAENVKLELIIFSQPANEKSLYLLDHELWFNLHFYYQTRKSLHVLPFLLCRQRD